MIYEYKDGYLTIDEAREAQAATDVAKLELVDAYYIAKLTIVRAYIIACIEDTTAPDDTYSAKLKHYKVEFDTLKSEAISAKSMQPSAWSAPMFRG